MSMLVEVPKSLVITSVSAIAIITATRATPRWRVRRRCLVVGATLPKWRSRSRKALSWASMSGPRLREVEGLLHPDPGLGGELHVLVVGALDDEGDPDPARHHERLAVGRRGVPGVLPVAVLPVEELELGARDV